SHVVAMKLGYFERNLAVHVRSIQHGNDTFGAGIITDRTHGHDQACGSRNAAEAQHSGTRTDCASDDVSELFRTLRRKWDLYFAQLYTVSRCFHLPAATA